VSAHRTPAADRFAKAVVRDSSGCWLWPGTLDRAGYARFRDDDMRKVFVHRWSYEYHVGPIPEGKVIDHLCRVRHCANPEHLEPVTQLENMRRGFHATKTNCKHGHPLVRVVDKDGPRRVCRICKRASAARSHQRLRRPDATAGGIGCPGTKGTT
jgi:HNH endonuclease